MVALPIQQCYSATDSSDGSLRWTTQTPLPVVTYTQAGAANGFLYVMGGYDQLTATCSDKCLLYQNQCRWHSGWLESNRSLPQPESLFGAVAANGFVFSIGGYNGSSPTSSFYVAAVKGDGSLGSWSSGTSLPLPIYIPQSPHYSYIFLLVGRQ